MEGRKERNRGKMKEVKRGWKGREGRGKRYEVREET